MSLADQFKLAGKVEGKVEGMVEMLENLINHIPEARRHHFKTALANAKTLEQVRALEAEILQSLPISA